MDSTALATVSEAPSLPVQTALSETERIVLADCEATIERGQKAFVEVGEALATIREKRLYRAAHRTFADYIRERWNLKKSHAYRLIASAQVVSSLSPIGDIVPATESQARPLTRLKSAELPEVWQRVLQRAPRNEDERPIVTAELVSNVVQEHLDDETEDFGVPERCRATDEQVAEFASELFDVSVTANEVRSTLAQKPTCHTCGHDQADEDRDCAKCLEPEIIKLAVVEDEQSDPQMETNEPATETTEHPSAPSVKSLRKIQTILEPVPDTVVQALRLFGPTWKDPWHPMREKLAKANEMIMEVLAWAEDEADRRGRKKGAGEQEQGDR